MASSNARYDNVDNVNDTLSSSSEISEDEIDLSSCEDYCEEIGGWGKCVEPYKFQPLKSVSEDRYTSVSNKQEFTACIVSPAHAHKKWYMKITYGMALNQMPFGSLKISYICCVHYQVIQSSHL
ncbi:hypothetical protein GQR58_024644 [Nymphon striatum]|nr:hypothetical protein GQR58_024644 [Nymphon striatum]